MQLIDSKLFMLQVPRPEECQRRLCALWNILNAKTGLDKKEINAELVKQGFAESAWYEVDRSASPFCEGRLPHWAPAYLWLYVTAYGHCHYQILQESSTE